MEPTGTYGDFLKAQAMGREIAVYVVSPKRCHDAAEIFDGVPSLHDAKATVLLAQLMFKAKQRSTRIQRTGETCELPWNDANYTPIPWSEIMVAGSTAEPVLA